MTQPLRIAIAGLGTVGAGIISILQSQGAMLDARAGRALQIVAVSARDKTRDRGVALDAYAWEDDAVALARRTDVDLVIEVIGGEDGTARAVCEAALAAGKHLVTANKAMMARHGQALAEAAEEKGVALRFEAAVAGGIPIVKALIEGHAANQITRIIGVLNGTCNYILTAMEATGASYTEALKEAQRLGYAEADPAFDVGGIDAAQKLALMAAAGFGTRVDIDAVSVEGIERVTIADIRHARDIGYSIKLLGVASCGAEGVEARMQPCLVPALSAFGELGGVTNMVAIEGVPIGCTIHSGPGAGAGPTASAVLGDVIDIARGLVMPAFGIPARALRVAKPANGGAPAAYYLRIQLEDVPGTLATVATELGRQGISIDRMRQYDHPGTDAPVVIVTHKCARAALDAALARIAATDVCHGQPVALRIADI